MAKFWRKWRCDWRFWVAILPFLISGTYWIYDVSAQVVKVPKIEEVQTKLDKRLTRIDYNVYLIGKRLSLPILQPSKDE